MYNDLLQFFVVKVLCREKFYEPYVTSVYYKSFLFYICVY